MLRDAQIQSKALWSMNDFEYIEYKDDKTLWKYYQKKEKNETRIMAVDIALLESSKNDNTAIWVFRIFEQEDGFKKICAYGESMHGLNSIVQVLRIKQLFYELECDYVVLDTQGNGVGVYDIATDVTYDEFRDEHYPAWTVVNPENVKFDNRKMTDDAVRVIYSVSTTPQMKHNMFVNARNMISAKDVILLGSGEEAIEYLIKNYEFYKITDDDLRSRLLRPYSMTNTFIIEAINLEQVNNSGYINLREKSGRRKDCVMSFVYGLWYIKQLEDDMSNTSTGSSILDYLFIM